MRRIMLALALVTLAAPAGAAMTIGEFIMKAKALQAKGMMALFSGDLGLLKREGSAATEALRRERLAAKAAGRTPAYCPPEGKSQVKSDSFIAELEAIPPNERGMSVKDGFARVLAKRYPCR